jgi:pyruvate,water dikinase
MSADDLAKNPPQEIKADFENFLSKYGCRSRHRTLFIKRWSENPQEIIRMLQSLVRNHYLKSSEPIGGSRQPKQTSDTALPFRSTLCSMPCRLPDDRATIAVGSLSVTRFSVRLIARISRRYLDLREDLRFTLDRILHLIRQTLLTLGDQTGLGDKVLFLKSDELEDVVREKLDDMQAKRKAIGRYNEFIRPFEVATFYNDGLAENEFQGDKELIRGIGTSPGQVSGRAKIVSDPYQADIRKGDILIAKNTDPGWTPILSIVGGMVMEEGGLLNHCSIVARELGVPSIVGVHQATRRIKDNDQIMIDGGLGVVMIEE